jgi:hypothetical protein
MGIVIGIDLAVVAWLIVRAVRNGFESTLPLATFLVILFPVESQITIPGLFDLTTQRFIVLTLLGLYLVFGRTPADGSAAYKLPIAGLLALQIVWMCLATANSVVFSISLKTVLSQILDFFALFFVFAKGIRSRETMHRILWAFVSAMILLAVFAAIETYWDWSVLSLFPQISHRFDVASDQYDRIDRVRTTFGHPILFGGTLAMAIPAALYLLRLCKTKSARILLCLGIGLMFLAIYKTDSRGPWLALGMSIVMFTLLGGKQLRRYLAVLSTVVVLTLLLRPGIWATLHDMYTATRDPDSPMGVSYQWRYALYDLVEKQLGHDAGRAVWGYGPESFYYLGLTTDFYLDGEIRTVKVDSCDSSVAALMMETGYFGFAITALLLLAPLLIALRSYLKDSDQDRQLPLLFACNMGAYYFLMTNVAIYGWGQQSYVLWIIVAMASLYPQLAKSTSTATEEPEHTDTPREEWGTARALPDSHIASL